MRQIVWLFVLALLSISDAFLSRRMPSSNKPKIVTGNPNAANCTERWFNQTIDHFNWGPLPDNLTTYQQRYYTYDKYWKPDGPIFFYAGNEGDVTLYVNNTGLMWENAQSFGAYLIFAEHRYYGESLPFPNNPFAQNHMHWLTMEQALADYATLLYQVKIDLNASNAPVVAFGGSYGGMLAAWMRIKYPSAIVGAIAASAPIAAFHGMNPSYDTESYWAVVTRDASSAGGSEPNCSSNVRAAWDYMFSLGQTTDGRNQLSAIFQMCTPLQTTDDVSQLALFVKMAWDTAAMGNYPYPSSYLTGGVAELPAFPVRAMCTFMKGPFTDPNGLDLLKALNSAAAVVNNATQDLKCYTLPTDTEYDGIWDYQWCTELLPQESYFTCDGKNDMFYPYEFNYTFVQERCWNLWGVQPRPDWIRISFGDRSVPGASNIVFSNGEYDPWSSGGIPQSLSDSVVSVFIEQGAHHLDLFFSNPQDPISLINARAIELEHISIWVNEYQMNQKKQKQA